MSNPEREVIYDTPAGRAGRPRRLVGGRRMLDREDHVGPRHQVRDADHARGLLRHHPIRRLRPPGRDHQGSRLRATLRAGRPGATDVGDRIASRDSAPATSTCSPRPASTSCRWCGRCSSGVSVTCRAATDCASPIWIAAPTRRSKSAAPKAIRCRQMSSAWNWPGEVRRPRRLSLDDPRSTVVRDGSRPVADVRYCKIYSTIMRQDAGPLDEAGEQLWKVNFGTPPPTTTNPPTSSAIRIRTSPRSAAEQGVFHGTVVDYSKTPESLRPKNSFAAVSFDAVNKAFRDGQVFSSTYYDNTIGLFIGPSHFGDGGQKTSRTPQPGIRGIQVQGAGSLGTRDCAADMRCPDRRVHRCRAKRTSSEISRSSSRPASSPSCLGLPSEDLPTFRRRAVQLINYTVKYERAFEASAALKDYFLEQIEQRRARAHRGHHRRSGQRGD